MKHSNLNENYELTQGDLRLQTFFFVINFAEAEWIHQFIVNISFSLAPFRCNRWTRNRNFRVVIKLMRGNLNYEYAHGKHSLLLLSYIVKQIDVLCILLLWYTYWTAQYTKRHMIILTDVHKYLSTVLNCLKCTTGDITQSSSVAVIMATWWYKNWKCHGLFLPVWGWFRRSVGCSR